MVLSEFLNPSRYELEERLGLLLLEFDGIDQGSVRFARSVSCVV